MAISRRVDEGTTGHAFRRGGEREGLAGLVGRAGGARGRVGPRSVGILTTGNRWPAEFGFVASRADDGRDGELHCLGIAADGVARGAHVVATLAEVRERSEGHVELVGEARGEPWGPLGAPPSHDDRWTGLLYRFRQGGW